jgi:hypothetical protein
MGHRSVSAVRGMARWDGRINVNTGILVIIILRKESQDANYELVGDDGWHRPNETGSR